MRGDIRSYYYSTHTSVRYTKRGIASVLYHLQNRGRCQNRTLSLCTLFNRKKFTRIITWNGAGFDPLASLSLSFPLDLASFSFSFSLSFGSAAAASPSFFAFFSFFGFSFFSFTGFGGFGVDPPLQQLLSIF